MRRALLLIVGALLFVREKNVVTTIIPSNPPMRVRHDRRLQVDVQATGDDADAPRMQTVFRAWPVDNTMEALVAVRIERGLRIVTALTRVDLLRQLLGTIARAYPERFPNFTKEQERSFTVDGHRAVEVFFTYTSPRGGTIRQRLWVVEYDPDTAVYVTAQARAENFFAWEKEYLALAVNFD